MRLPAKLSANVSRRGPGLRAIPRHSGMVPAFPLRRQRDQSASDHAQAIRTLLAGCAQLHPREAQVASVSCWSRTKRSLEIRQEFLLCQSYCLRLSSNTGSLYFETADYIHLYFKIAS